MQTAPQIDFQGMEPSLPLQAKILQQIERLESRYGRVTSCRVVVKAPGGHHLTGGLYEINIRLSIPDRRDVVVERTPRPDERFQDFDFALNDAFRRARRRLQDQVRRMRGDTKCHEAHPAGVVKALMREEGYGLIESADGREIYFHRNSVSRAGFDGLQPGARVSFKEEQGDKGPQASQVTPLAERAPL
jgi:cold shock CspA family protein